MERRHAPLSHRPQKAGHVALHRVRLADVFRAPDRLCLRALVKRLADTIPILSEHHLLDGDDALPALVEPDDGDGRLGFGARRHEGCQEVDTADYLLRSGIYCAPLD